MSVLDLFSVCAYVRTNGEGADDEGKNGQVRAAPQSGDEEVSSHRHEQEFGGEDEHDLHTCVPHVGRWMDG